MKRVAAVGLALFLALFLLPLLLHGGEGTDGQGNSPSLNRASPAPTPGAADSACTVRVAMADGTVEEMSMGEYLWGVTAAEMPASFEEEALKAQAAAARTYTRRKMGHPVSAHPDADVCTDITCCQAWRSREDAKAAWGDEAETYEAKIARAVAETDGMIITYGGEPIQAVFFSSAAGRTVDAVEVWGNSVPYLTGVESPEGEEVPNYHTEVTLTPAECREKLLGAWPEMTLGEDPAAWFSGIVYDSAGGVERMSVGGVEVTGSALRTLFGLRSAHFTVAAGAEGVTFSVTGYGHGVGMSQYGANALAREGKTWQEIIKWYYTGV